MTRREKMANFYHVFIESKKDITYEQVKAKMDLALDWFRCNSNTWVLYTTSDEDKLRERFKSIVEPEGNLFICKLNIDKRNGWMVKDFWEWIKKNIE